MYKTITILFLSFFLIQCDSNSDELSKEDCSAVQCADSSLKVLILSSTTNENLIENGTYTLNDISVLDEDNKPVAFSVNISTSEPAVYIQLNSIVTEIRNYTMILKTQTTANFELAIEKTGEGNTCCGIENQINSISVSGVTSEIDSANRTITVFIE